MTTIPLGALHKQTGQYVYPGIATKDSEYVCPDCNRDLILVKGPKRVHHFRHKVNAINPCMHYDNPGESQIHKDAKLLLKTMLENGVLINILRNCRCCKNNETYEIPALSESSQIILEHRFEHNGPKVADVAYMDSGEIVCIFEICHTHATSANDRPEPWFEIDATTLIMDANNILQDKDVNIKCIRSEKCEECIKIVTHTEIEDDYNDSNSKRIHKAINIIREYINSKKQISIDWYCPNLKQNDRYCGTHHGGMKCNVNYEENNEIKIDCVNGMIIIKNNNKVKYVFEIDNDRKWLGEPRYCVDSRDVMNPDSVYEENTLLLTCIRSDKSRYCDNCRILGEKWVQNIPRLDRKYSNEKGWCQELPCIICKRRAYSPVFINGYRQLCKLCLTEHSEELKNTYTHAKCIIDLSIL